MTRGRIERRRGPRRAPLLRSLVVFWALLATHAVAVDYYPASAGASWTYSSGETQILSGPRDWGGLAVMVLTHYLNGVPVSEDYLVFDAAGVRTVGTAAAGNVVRYDPPLIVYPAAPLQPGTVWTSTTDVATASGTVGITLSAEVLGLRGVQTQAGRFNALQIRQRTLTSTGGSTVLDLFLVPGVGVVRFVTEDGTTIDLIERGE